ncbi:GNAT family N-acetyltransferase, partial [bacterium]|nr:GNAT family N-acetyltransferase [bacterium]
MAEIEIRLYTEKDRERVRFVVFETGYMGDPVGWLWRDRESFADLFTRYYTDREPESLFVAESEGDVVGYLTGCVDSSRVLGTAMRESLRIIGRGALFRPGLAGFFWRSIFDIVRDHGTSEDVLTDVRWPAHLHIDLLPEARGKGVGRRLISRWLARLRELGSRGVHLGTFAENRNAIRFFEACGFERYGDPLAAPGFRTRGGRRMHTQWMVRSLVDSPDEHGAAVDAEARSS